MAVTLWSPPIGDIQFPGLTGTTIDNMAIGGTTPAAVTALPLKIDTGTKTATSTGAGATGTVTLNKLSGIVTTPSLTTAAGSTYVLTMTNSQILATDIVQFEVGTPGNGWPGMVNVQVSAGQIIATIANQHASAAFNNVLNIMFTVFRA